jgi:hypothetical protein
MYHLINNLLLYTTPNHDSILERLAEEAAKEAENAESEETVSEDEVIVHG